MSLSPTLCIIVAVAENGVIGAGGKMPWHISAELKYFRACTIGKPVVMGRKTFESVGKPLPGRDNIVVTRDAAFAPEGVMVTSSLDEALAVARERAAAAGASEIMVIGGAEIYRQAMPLASRLYLTRIEARPAGDTFFALPDPGEWHLVEQHDIPRGERDTAGAKALVYERVARVAPAH